MRYPLMLGAVLVPFCCCGIAIAQNGSGNAKPKTGSRWALLVGVDDYAEAQKLHFCGADMLALRDHLISAGFPERQVIVLHDKAQETKYRPTKHNVQRQLELMLGLVAKDDLLVVGFSGHGIQIRGKSYLCPADTELNVSDSMVPLDRVYDQLDHCPAALKLVLVDACRNDPRQAGQKGVLPSEGVKQFAASLERPPKGILMLTSCAPGQISMEDQDFGHGVFMHFLLEGLEGKADAEGKGRVSLVDLYGYANRETKAYVMRKFNGTQTPALKGDLNDDFDLAASGPDPKEYIQKALALALTLNESDYRGGGSQAQQLSKLAYLQSLAGDRVGMTITFQRAKAVAKQAYDHIAIGIAQANAGDIEGAKDTAATAGEDRGRLQCSIAEAQARLGRFSDALNTVGEIVVDSHFNWRRPALISLAHYQFLAGHKEDARKALRDAVSLRDVVSRYDLWTADFRFLASWLAFAAESGDSATAHDAIRRLMPVIEASSDEYKKCFALVFVVSSQHMLGEDTKAKETLQLLVTKANNAIDGGVIAGADGAHKSYLLLEVVARAQAKVGEIDAARATLKRCRQLLPSRKSSQYGNGDAIRGLVRNQSRIGDFGGSLETLSDWLAREREREYPDRYDEINILAEMARDYALCGRIIDADRTFAEAVELADKDRSWGSAVVSLEFVRLARKGVYKELLAIAERRLPRAYRVDVYMSIAEGFFWRRGIKVGDQDPDEPF